MSLGNINTVQIASHLSCRGKGQRRLAACAHLPDDEAMQGLYHFGTIDTIGVSMTKFTYKCKW